MAKSKFRLTGFARFLFMMIVLAPLAYIGASYYNGEDGIQNIKNIFTGGGNSTEMVAPPRSVPAEQATTRTAPSKEYVDSQVKKLSDDLAEKESRIEKLYLENEELKKQLREKETELTDVKAQFDKIRSALGQ